MSYATLADLIERAGADEIAQIADRDGDGVPDADVVDAAIETASTTIDSYLAGRCVLPLDPVPLIARKWAVAIARYQLHRFEAPDYVVRDYKDAQTELRDAAAGRLSLPGVAGIEPAQGASGQASAEGSPPVFTDQALWGWL